MSIPKIEETVLEINLKALAHNYHYLRSKINDQTKLLGVVKAFAYGSDAVIVASHLQQLGINYFAVAYAKEGLVLREQGITKPILVLHTLPGNFDTILYKCLEPSIYSLKLLEAFIAFAKKNKQKNYPIHLKINTGLNRLGFHLNELNKAITLIKENNCVKVTSIFSHLAATEDLNENNFTLSQIEKFKESSKKIIQLLGYAPILHTLNTSGILNYPEAQFDMVRSGIGLYGFGNDPVFSKHLKPIASLLTPISQIHHLKKGETLGYNRAYKATKAIKTATLPLGHADGIGRIYGQGKGWVIINNQKAPIIGNVCMDMIMVEVTHINCKEGDVAIIFNATHSAELLAEQAGTISYELITSISQRVKRIYKS